MHPPSEALDDTGRGDLGGYIFCTVFQWELRLVSDPAVYISALATWPRDLCLSSMEEALPQDTGFRQFATR
jgi:hypothetical protein